MKKFLTRALPLCLALLIFVGSMAVPAFAAETDTVTISGTWQYNEVFDPVHLNEDGGPESVSAEFSYHVLDPNPDYDYHSLDFWAYGNISGYYSDSFVGFVDCGDYGEGASPFVIIIDSPSAVSSEFYSVFSANFTRIDDAAVLDSSNDDSIFSVFAGISGWIVTAIGDLMPMFYTEATGLTFIGTLAVAALAFAVIFLVIAIIRRFMHFGG